VAKTKSASQGRENQRGVLNGEEGG